MDPPIGRLAPSTNGALHLGHARSFLIAWWVARAAGGSVVLRYDDLDPTRCKPEHERAALRDLQWLGLDWEGAQVQPGPRLGGSEQSILRQSERGPLYRAAAELLIATSGAYPCVCTRKEILLAAPHRGEEPPPYPGTCRGKYSSLAQAERDSGRKPMLRFPAPSQPVVIDDLLHGTLERDLATDCGDFPILTREGLATYQLATVVDDAAQSVAQVVRGDDLIPSAFRQAALQDALGHARPTWIHVPLVVEEGGHRLAKRSADRPIAALRQAGLDPRVLVAWAARSAGQLAPDPITPGNLPQPFDLSRLPRTPAVLDAPTRALLGLAPPRETDPGT